MTHIEILPGEDGRLIVRFPYCAESVAQIKTIEGRRWHPGEKYWTVPRCEGMPARLRALLGGENGAKTVIPPGLLKRVHEAVRSRHLSPNTEEAYLGWIRRFIEHSGQPPEELGEAEVGRFLSGLATDAHVSASTQN